MSLSAIHLIASSLYLTITMSLWVNVKKKSKTEMIGFNISQFTEWKKEKFTLMKKKFREINFLTTYLGKTLFSRNFCQKKVTVNFCKFHSVKSCPLFFVIVRLLYAHSFLSAPSFSVYKTLHSICLCDKLRCLPSFCNFQLVTYYS